MQEPNQNIEDTQNNLTVGALQKKLSEAEYFLDLCKDDSDDFTRDFTIQLIIKYKNSIAAKEEELNNLFDKVKEDKDYLSNLSLPELKQKRDLVNEFEDYANNSKKRTHTITQLLSQLNFLIDIKLKALLEKGIKDTKDNFFMDASHPLDEAMEIDPNYPGLKEAKIAQLFGRAKSNERKRYDGEANLYFKEALELDPNNKDIKYHYYCCRIRQNDLSLLLPHASKNSKQKLMRDGMKWHKKILDEIDANDPTSLLEIGRSLLGIDNLSKDEEKFALQCLDKLGNEKAREIEHRYYKKTAPFFIQTSGSKAVKRDRTTEDQCRDDFEPDASSHKKHAK